MLRNSINVFTLDFVANRGNTKSMLVVLLFRLSGLVRILPFPFCFVLYPIRVAYKIFVNYILGIDLPDCVRVGGGLRIFHGFGLVVHPNVEIGIGCILRHGVTLGNAKEGGPVPIIGDYVEFGCNSSVIGGVGIGSGAKIGAGSVVILSVPENRTVVGVPGRVL